MCSAIDTRITGKLKIAIALTGITLVAEVAGSFWTNSLALLSDATHVILDLFALILSLTAVKLANLQACSALILPPTLSHVSPAACRRWHHIAYQISQ